MGLVTDAHQIEPREEGHRMLSTNLHTSVKAKSGRLEMPCLLFRSDNGLGMNKKKYIWIGDWALAGLRFISISRTLRSRG